MAAGVGAGGGAAAAILSVFFLLLCCWFGKVRKLGFLVSALILTLQESTVIQVESWFGGGNRR